MSCLCPHDLNLLSQPPEQNKMLTNLYSSSLNFCRDGCLGSPDSFMVMSVRLSMYVKDAFPEDTLHLKHLDF